MSHRYEDGINRFFSQRPFLGLLIGWCAGLLAGVILDVVLRHG